MGIPARLPQDDDHWSNRLGYKDRPLSPRMKLALRLYNTGAARTKGEAAQLAGLAKGSFYVMTSPAAGNEAASNLSNEMDELLQDQAINVTVLMEKLSEKAIRKIGKLMDSAGKEEVQLRAAMELADRGSRTAKIHKQQNMLPTLDDVSAKTLAAALVESASARQRHIAAASGDYVRVDASIPFDASVLDVEAEDVTD